MKRLVIVLACIQATGALAADNDYPAFGMLMGEQAKDLMQFKCDPPTVQGLTCHFTQILVSKGGGPEKLKKSLANAPDLLKELEGGKAADTCASMKNLAHAIRTGATLPDKNQQAFLEKLTKNTTERADTLRSFESVETACNTPTKENVEAWLRAENDKDTRTCSLLSNSFEQTFTIQSPNIWVHNGGPDGLCGVVTVTTFERDKDANSKMFWNYRTRKIVTSKDALDTTLLNCRMLDEGEYLYTWRTETYFKGCDYIKYGF